MTLSRCTFENTKEIVKPRLIDENELHRKLFTITEREKRNNHEKRPRNEFAEIVDREKNCNYWQLRVNHAGRLPRVECLK